MERGKKKITVIIKRSTRAEKEKNDRVGWTYRQTKPQLGLIVSYVYLYVYCLFLETLLFHSCLSSVTLLDPRGMLRLNWTETEKSWITEKLKINTQKLLESRSYRLPCHYRVAQELWSSLSSSSISSFWFSFLFEFKKFWFFDYVTFVLGNT